MAAAFCLLLLLLSAYNSLSATAPGTANNETVFDVTNAELKEISEQLYALDVNKAQHGKDYVVNIRGPRLFTRVNAEVLRRPTFAALRAVQKIYTPETGSGRDEPECPPCAPEENAFLDSVLETSVIRKVHEFLSSKGLAAPTMSEFRTQLRQWWFKKYSRSKGSALDSSGFEHVFAVDLRGRKIGGYHNWVYFYDGETGGTTRYLRFLRSCEPNVLTFRFSYRNIVKNIGGFFLGTSPEYDLAIKTLCFRARTNRFCSISQGGKTASVKTYSMSGVYPVTIGTAYPVCN